MLKLESINYKLRNGSEDIAILNDINIEFER